MRQQTTCSLTRRLRFDAPILFIYLLIAFYHFNTELFALSCVLSLTFESISQLVLHTYTNFLLGFKVNSRDLALIFCSPLFFSVGKSATSTVKAIFLEKDKHTVFCVYRTMSSFSLVFWWIWLSLYPWLLKAQKFLTRRCRQWNFVILNYATLQTEPNWKALDVFVRGAVNKKNAYFLTFKHCQTLLQEFLYKASDRDNLERIFWILCVFCVSQDVDDARMRTER